MCPSVCPSVTSQRWLNLGSLRQRLAIVQGFQFTVAEDLGDIPTGLLPTGAPNRGMVGYN